MPDVLVQMLTDRKLSAIPFIKSQLLRDFISFTDSVGFKPPYNTDMVNSFISLKLVTPTDMKEFCSPIVSMGYVKRARENSIREMDDPQKSDYEKAVMEMKRF